MNINKSKTMKIGNAVNGDPGKRCNAASRGESIWLVENILK